MWQDYYFCGPSRQWDVLVCLAKAERKRQLTVVFQTHTQCSVGSLFCHLNAFSVRIRSLRMPGSCSAVFGQQIYQSLGVKLALSFLLTPFYMRVRRTQGKMSLLQDLQRFGQSCNMVTLKSVERLATTSWRLQHRIVWFAWETQMTGFNTAEGKANICKCAVLPWKESCAWQKGLML